MVTGLVVNEKANIRSEYYRNARAMCDSLFQTGQYFKDYVPAANADDPPIPNLTDNLNPLAGILNHIYCITQSEERRTVQEQREDPRAIRALYRRFLFYKYCIAPNAPLIITEGKTDPIYIQEAIKRRAKYHPKLGEKKEGSFKYAVRFYNYGGQVHEIMDLGGGSGDLKSVPLDYLRNLDTYKGARKPFSHKPMRYPVILVLDNDDGLGSVAGTIKKNFGKTITVSSSEDFYHITENLYLVKTPEKKGGSCIEDMFEEKVKKKKLNGKSLSLKSKIDATKEYGKEVFAKSVVKADAASINFSGFDVFLDRIVAAIDDYKSSLT